MCVCKCITLTTSFSHKIRAHTFSRSSKLYVSFAKEPYKWDHILQKWPIILRSLLIVANPYTFSYTHTFSKSSSLHENICIKCCVRMYHSHSIIFTFAEYLHFNRALLQKRPRILRSLLIEATPYCFWISRTTQFHEPNATIHAQPTVSLTQHHENDVENDVVCVTQHHSH